MDHEKDDRDLLIQVVVTLLKVSPLNVGPLNELEGLTLTVYWSLPQIWLFLVKEVRTIFTTTRTKQNQPIYSVLTAI